MDRKAFIRDGIQGTLAIVFAAAIFHYFVGFGGGTVFVDMLIFIMWLELITGSHMKPGPQKRRAKVFGHDVTTRAYWIMRRFPTIEALRAADPYRDVLSIPNCGYKAFNEILAIAQWPGIKPLGHNSVNVIRSELKCGRSKQKPKTLSVA